MKSENVASFGELLKVFRKQKHIGQQQVAERLAVHRNTVGAWERGDRLPDTRGMVLELARCLQLDQQETARLLEVEIGRDALIVAYRVWELQAG
ncbi:MAG TPA: helix-turn-helix transcriptional regulator [Ktedonobacteraceae bacterium]|nr:helix-turn-helix transcriptional regulator [Ktedonobacteraceae bacterium]